MGERFDCIDSNIHGCREMPATGVTAYRSATRHRQTMWLRVYILVNSDEWVYNESEGERKGLSLYCTYCYKCGIEILQRITRVELHLL
jgi:hypothetical protein